MKREFVYSVIEEKIRKNSEIVKIHIDDIGLSIQDTCDFIMVAKEELIKMGYTIYFPENTYVFKGNKFTVGDGELLVGIK